MVIKEGDFIEVNYTAKELETGKIFDTTKPGIAKREKLFPETYEVFPLITVIGEKELLPNLEAKIKEMNEGEERKIVLSPTEAFGERKSELIMLVALSQFRKRQINPYPGMPIDLNGMNGKVQTVNGGRVRVDFNHPLAGKRIEYDLKIERILNDKNEKIKSVVDKFLFFVPKDKREYKLTKDKLEVKVSKEQAEQGKAVSKAFSDMIKRNFKDIKEVLIVEEFGEKKETKTKKEKPTKN